ncbi:MAG: Dph6-related ATP pyrophosphatase [Gemmatimonadaceae bacterium]
MSNDTRRIPAAFSWSGGKDSSLALQAVLAEGRFQVTRLVTTVTEAYDRVSMHGVRTELLRAQARAVGFPLHEIRLPVVVTGEVYENAMREHFGALAAQGVKHVLFGDLFLEDIRAYRERQTAQLGMTCEFPLWMRDTRRLAEEFVEQGFRAVLVSVDPKAIDPSFCGRELDRDLLRDLPPECDPCGENGEFHTFVYDGPILANPVPVHKGEVVERSGFYYCDLLPA